MMDNRLEQARRLDKLIQLHPRLAANSHLRKEIWRVALSFERDAVRECAEKAYNNLEGGTWNAIHNRWPEHFTEDK